MFGKEGKLFKKKDKTPAPTVEEEYSDGVDYNGVVSNVYSDDSYESYTVPSDGKQVVDIVRLEFKHFLKTKSFFVLFVLAAIVPIIQMSGAMDIVGNISSFFSIFIKNPGEMSGNTFMHLTLCLLPLIMLFCMVFFCGRTISNEYANRTAYLNLPLPMKRWVIFTGKFIAITAISFSILLFAYGMGFLCTSLKYDNVLIMPVFESLIATLFAMMALVATGMLFSALLKKRGGLMSFALIFVILPMIVPIAIEILNSMMKTSISYEFLNYTLPFAVDQGFLLMSADPTISLPSIMILIFQWSIPSIWIVLLESIVWAAVCFAGGLYLFNKKEV